MEKKKIIEIEMNSMHELNSAYANAITRIEDRYLSSKITHNKGDFKGIPWENFKVVINFLAGEAPNYFSLNYSKECATRKEAEQLESQAISIIEKYIKNPNDKFFKTITLQLELWNKTYF